MNYDAMSYENPWRTNYESAAAGAWIAGAVGSLTALQVAPFPPEPFYWMIGLSTLMASIRVPQAIKLAKLQRTLKGRKLEKIHIKRLINLMDKKPGTIWLGNGFVWENRHAQRVHEILKRDWSDIVKYTSEKATSDQVGQNWIHGVEPSETAIRQALSHSEGQNLILGTTGAGKTRLFDLLISQAIFRGEAVIIIDPKGDRDLYRKAQRACIAAGDPDRFVFFHPAFPERSARIDPLANFSRVTEIASRLAALIPSEAGADPFKSFGWQAINNIAQALVFSYERPSIILLKRFLESGPQQMVVRAVTSYAERELNDGVVKVQNLLRSLGPNQNEEKMARAMSIFYKEEVQPEAPSPELEALISMFQHDKTHFAKMVSNLLPIMNMLTAGDLADLLSPDYSDITDLRTITDNKKIINNGQVAYIGLDSLTDNTVGAAIGSLLLSDLVSVAGDRYNYGVGNKPVNIFIDEAAEVINDPTIALLNKGRGALMKLFVATQTIADFETRLGSKEKARQVLGNMNNLYVLRVIDPETQLFVTENLPKTRIKSVVRDQGFSSNSDSPLRYSAKTGEKLMEEEADLFPPQLLGMLPNLEYIAKISGGMIIKGRLPILEDEMAEAA